MTKICGRKSDYIENDILEVIANIGTKCYNTNVKVVYELYRNGQLTDTDEAAFTLYERENNNSLVAEKFYDIKAEFEVTNADKDCEAKIYIMSGDAVLAEKTLTYKEWMSWSN